ncbi:hypothetical protein QR680_019421 [Steinernema hermaphroditum]|uniref:Uncharacterized protein n=1 Tax=Steinernema hermaphroditum TaxID=289476 RepID=A0AA39LA46_9BILA|nr:hypothetical protein QR680_019421 [Steinernema hermaphroditum]
MSRRKTPSSAGSSDDNVIPWPSTAAILETPDRKRLRRSIESTSDYSLATCFGSPDSHQIPLTTSPLLKTPVHNGKTCIHLTPSPLSSFRVRESISGNLKLSNPDNATEMRFTGSSLERFSPVKLGQGRPLAPIQSNVSRCLNDTFRLNNDSAYSSCNDSSLFFDSFKDTRRNDLFDTPSKMMRSSLDLDASFDFTTSTPVKPCCAFSIYRSDFIPEQPSGRLETCITDTSDFMISPTRYIDQSPVKPPPKPVERIPIITQSIARRLFPKNERPNPKPETSKTQSLTKLLDDFDPFLSESDRDLLIKAGYGASAMSFPKPSAGADSRPPVRGPFAGKKKQLKPIFTFNEIRQACAETKDAFELVHQAKRYLREHQKRLKPEN